MIVSAWVHPGESNSSYMMEGFLTFILGNSKEAEYLWENLIIKVIPMSNPDGVICGNYRTSVSGNDLNRQYHAPDKRLHPTVMAIKNLVSTYSSNPM